MAVSVTFTGITSDTGSSGTDLVTNDTSLTLAGTYTVISAGGVDSFSIWFTGGEFGCARRFSSAASWTVPTARSTGRFPIPGVGATLDPAVYTVSFKTGVNSGQVNEAVRSASRRWERSMSIRRRR